jgi:pimeloyl-ACP methyl ester carboxylesterase
MIQTTSSTFSSRGIRCACWVTHPQGPGPHPALVLAHGFGANHTMALQTYEQHFAAAGIATLAFDYRHLGASDGLPKQRLSLRRHRQDLIAALDHVRELPGIDRTRVGLWGTSLGAMHVLRVAAERPDVAAVVVQCPIVDGPATLTKLGAAAAIRLAPAVIADAVRQMVRVAPYYVPIVGPPGTVAAVTVAGAMEGWNSTISPGGSFENRVGAADVLQIAVTSAKRAARRIRAPLLVCVSEHETLIDPHHVETVARRASRGEARHYAGDHFAIYHPPLVDDLLADQTAFLRRHLHVT